MAGSEKKLQDSHKNYSDYIHGKAPLKVAMLSFDDNDKVLDLITKSMRRSMWVIPLSKMQEYQDKIKKNEA